MVQLPLAAEIGHVAVYVRQSDRFNKSEVHAANVDLIQRQAPQIRLPQLADIPQEVSEVQIVFIDRFQRVGLDGFMLGQKIDQYFGRVLAVIQHLYHLSFLINKLNEWTEKLCVSCVQCGIRPALPAAHPSHIKQREKSGVPAGSYPVESLYGIKAIPICGLGGYRPIPLP